VKPYSRASPPDENEPPLRAWTSGSAASAATARPTKRGDSEIAAKCFTGASRQLSSVTPKVSSIISDLSQPGVSASAVHPCGASSCAWAKARRTTAFLTRS
jgi:hypothetical protein